MEEREAAQRWLALRFRAPALLYREWSSTKVRLNAFNSQNLPLALKKVWVIMITVGVQNTQQTARQCTTPKCRVYFYVVYWEVFLWDPQDCSLKIVNHFKVYVRQSMRRRRVKYERKYSKYFTRRACAITKCRKSASSCSVHFQVPRVQHVKTSWKEETFTLTFINISETLVNFCFNVWQLTLTDWVKNVFSTDHL